ncbi:yrdC domain-containing protein, mitochondrial isoform X1 [Selaginella moellendorffii]|uniref:yrdC domain-containing protein, mitochondrial isoform X1 n=1 Tax=Selaginella moellendorffii TaxID=88036 RepID=UPI000D1CE2CC|nr:yrdC domain-containing protein, mitochondrial isoform X1 [Selaginella moellendorffii]|eukprot:XP_002991001.2 yrdC domain-containing protein, mitochondrial isoform X1 [Selaginella moellendorffii]
MGSFVSEKVLAATQENVRHAIAALRRGDVISVPTDTLYGLAADACSRVAVERIYDIKGRNAGSPLAVCVADVPDLKRYARIDHLPDALLHDLLPGPVTLVLNRGDKSELEKSLNPGLLSIGIRIPDSDFIRSVARAFDGALALTSANTSSRPSSICVEEFEHLWPQCAAVFDAGELSAGRAGSTIVDLTAEASFKVLRAGSALQETKKCLIRHGLSERS